MPAAEAAGAGSRAQPFYCPYCAEEDFVPWGEERGMFYCQSCNRRYKVAFLGLGEPPGSGREATVAGE